jgi:PTS system nitrogen regulatory IIA component
MEISDFLSPEHSISGIQIADKATLLKELCARAAVALNLDADTILSAIHKREQLGSTGVGAGIAIPHARIEGVQRPFGMLASLAKPIDYGAVDDRRVDVVFMLLLPRAAADNQLNTLAIVARKLRNPAVLARLRKTSNQTSLYRAIIET